MPKKKIQNSEKYKYVLNYHGGINDYKVRRIKICGKEGSGVSFFMFLIDESNESNIK